MIEVLVGVFLGILYVNFLEWFFHRFVLHGHIHRGKDFKDHMNHHRRVNTYFYKDDKFSRGEFLNLLALSVVHLPILYYWSAFYAGAFLWACVYYVIHKYSHKYPKWGKKYIPWHFHHHMTCPNSNWCVTIPLWDLVLGTYNNGTTSQNEWRYRKYYR